jgi:hypothetical protein
MQSQGYWYHNGKLFELKNGIHIDFIIAYPKKFGLTDEYIKDMYNTYGEKLGQEGHARQQLIMDATLDGWIRVRHYTRPRDYWSIQCDEVHKRKSDIKSMVEELMLTGIMYKSDELIITGFVDEAQIQYAYADGGADTFLSESKKLRVRDIRLIESFTDF